MTARRSLGRTLFALLPLVVVAACANDFDAFEAKPGESPGVEDGATGQDGNVSRNDGLSTPDGTTSSDASDASSSDGAPKDVSAEANVDAGDGGPTCTLPTGATRCCGSVPCRNAGGNCTDVCNACATTCNGAKPVCCAKGNGNVGCEQKPEDC